MTFLKNWNAMRIHYLQHVPFEGPGAIAAWAKARGHVLTGTRMDLGEPLPSPDAFDRLVVMGGPMSVHDEATLPWLATEKRFVKTVLDAGTPVLGICLGAQLLAEVLGGRVYLGPEKEIGWHPLRVLPAARQSRLAGLPESFVAFHWHGETFDLPPGATRLAETDVCPNQAFELGPALALQFHLEVQPHGVAELAHACGHELSGGRYVQNREQLLDAEANCRAVEPLLYDVLDRL